MKYAVTIKEKSVVLKLALLAVALFLIYVLGTCVFLYAMPIFLGAMAAMFLFSRKEKLAKRLGGRDKAAAGIIALSIILSVIMPLTGFGLFVADGVVDAKTTAMKEGQLQEWKNEAVDSVEVFIDKHNLSNPVVDRVIELAGTDYSQILAGLGLQKFAGKIGSAVLNFFTSSFSKFGTLAFILFLTPVFMYVFLIKGKKLLYDGIMPYVLFEDEGKKQIMNEVYFGMVKIFNSMIAVGLGQGSIAAFFIATYSIWCYPISVAWFIFLYIILVFSSGCGLSMGFPILAIYTIIALFQGNIIWAFVFVGAIILVGMSDNLIKLVVLGQKGEDEESEDALNPWILIMCTVGGLGVYGLISIVFVPFVIILASSSWRVFGKELIDELVGANEEEEKKIVIAQA